MLLRTRKKYRKSRMRNSIVYPPLFFFASTVQGIQITWIFKTLMYRFFSPLSSTPRNALFWTSGKSANKFKLKMNVWCLYVAAHSLQLSNDFSYHLRDVALHAHCGEVFWLEIYFLARNFFRQMKKFL